MCDIALTTSLHTYFVYVRLAEHIKVGFLPLFHIFSWSFKPLLFSPKRAQMGRMAVSASAFSFKSIEHTLHVSRQPTSSNACLPRLPKSTIAIYMLVCDPKTLCTPMYERCARPFKNTIKSFYVSGFSYKTPTTTRFHFSSLLVSLQQCKLKVPKRDAVVVMSVPAFSAVSQTAATVALLYHQNQQTLSLYLSKPETI